MGRPKGSGNKNPYPVHRIAHAQWYIVSERLAKELAAFKRMHNRVRDGIVQSIQWKRKLNGFAAFIKEIGPIPQHIKKPSVGRKRHAVGYKIGNVMWEEHSFNSIKRKGTRYES